MQDINWGNFKAKFHGKEQKSFEWLCYLLFCRRFNKRLGIFRYKNQAGIETNPIEIDGKFIGWQAKFFDTRLSEHKADFVSSIDISVTRYSNLNKIIFYTNQEFGQGKSENGPDCKQEIENYARNKNIEIEWCPQSYFESPFVCIDNEDIAEFFFSLDKGVVDAIHELSFHAELLLKPIQSNIVFNGADIKINRSDVLKNIKDSFNTSSIIILSGEAGVGKTAIIKDYFAEIIDSASFYAFKATEFNTSNINNLFKIYGKVTLTDFIKAHNEIENKYIVIDSAEKLSDISQPEVFQEFLSALTGASWKLIFTTRNSYLDDLRYQFVENYNLSFRHINIVNLTKDELIGLSRTHKFNIPSDERFLNLLTTPFYLNEYLKSYSQESQSISYHDFKEILWKKQISKSSFRTNNIHIKRETCFLEMAKERANSGRFYIKAGDCDNEALKQLESDEIIKHDSTSGGYFITHDIYEEWALNKIIEQAFSNLESYESFYLEIGSSLPVRRAFRVWLSEKLFCDKDEVKKLIDTTITDDKIERHWQDEVLISVLLSEHSDDFFVMYDKMLMANDQALLIRVCFLLRTACKEMDLTFLEKLGLERIENGLLNTLFQKPRGRGWHSTISFIDRYKSTLKLNHINMFLPLLDDWNNKFKEGETTRIASIIALFYYDEIAIQEGSWHSTEDEQTRQIIRTILRGSAEIKIELGKIFDDVIANKEKDQDTQYFALIHNALASVIESHEIAKTLPDKLIALADLFWFHIPNRSDWHMSSRIGIEHCFCVPESHFDYYPSSAFQTPILFLLKYSPTQTLDFIVSFTNKTTACYAKSELKNEIEEIELAIDNGTIIKQFISSRLWNTYRGTRVSTHLLESIHMALEKWLLQYVKSASEEDAENLCLHLLLNSKSASITAVVTSAIYSQPTKLFNVAIVIFRTKELFSYDLSRLIQDQTHKTSLEMLRNNFGSRSHNELFENERISACDDKHRQMTLEHLARIYQMFRDKEISEEEATQRQLKLWEIFDHYYDKLPDKSIETADDKTWRLCLARMDRRKMKIEAETKDDQIMISFNPHLEPELQAHSDEAAKTYSEKTKYLPLKMWSDYRFKRNSLKYAEYAVFEENPRLAFDKIKEIVDQLSNCKDEWFYLSNHSIPAYVSTVLIRDFSDKLNQSEILYCCELLMDIASIPIRSDRYSYQISDGFEPAISILPELFKSCPDFKDEIKKTLLLLLMNPYPQISTFAASTILNQMWDISFDDANSLFLGYMLLKPTHNELRKLIRHEDFKNGRYDSSEIALNKRLLAENEEAIKKVLSNQINNEPAPDIATIDSETLIRAFEVLPNNTTDPIHKAIIVDIIKVFATRLYDREDRLDYSVRHRFFNKFACIVLSASIADVAIYVKPILDEFDSLTDSEQLFGSFISTEIYLNSYDQFWATWQMFYDKISEICLENTDYTFQSNIIHNYLLAWPLWNNNVKTWASLRNREKIFYGKVAKELGNHPAVLYSIAKILNDIGSDFLEDGIVWIGTIIKNNPDLISDKLEVNTIYYIENIVRRYISINRSKIKTNRLSKSIIIDILSFLFEKGSVTGYLLREEIL